MAKKKKNRKFNKRETYTFRFATEAQIFDALEMAKDILFELINVKKLSWGIENWSTLHFYMQGKQWGRMEGLIQSFRNTKNSRLALMALHDIQMLEAELERRDNRKH